MQYPVIYAVLLHLNCCNSFSHYRAILVENRRRNQKRDDLAILATCRSGTLAMLSNKVNCPVGHGEHSVMTDRGHRLI